jgi:hypothetical protein
MASYIHTQAPDELLSAGGEREGRVRLRGAIVAGACFGAIALAVSLTPDPSGYGTHRQLGLPACSYRVNTGRPCPHCGLTTSVCAAFHGRLGLAFRAQPFGIVLAAALAVLAFAGFREVMTGRPFLHRLRPGWWWAAAALGGTFVGWWIVLALGPVGASAAP